MRKREVVRVALTEKQKRFVDEYLIDLNATQAAIRAGYSENTAEVIGYENLRKPQIAEKVQEAMQLRSRRVDLSQDMVAQELRKIGFAEAHDYTDADLKYGNKLKALELLGKHLGMFDGKGTGPKQENNLLDAIVCSAEGELDTDDLPEIQ